jgi:hypothetical protein
MARSRRMTSARLEVPMGPITQLRRRKVVASLKGLVLVLVIAICGLPDTAAVASVIRFTNGMQTSIFLEITPVGGMSAKIRIDPGNIVKYTAVSDVLYRVRVSPVDESGPSSLSVWDLGDIDLRRWAQTTNEPIDVQGRFDSNGRRSDVLLRVRQANGNIHMFKQLNRYDIHK